MDKKSLILDFIDRFNRGAQLRELFEGEASYHFSVILKERFKDEEIYVIYHPTYHVFATHINGRIYDITGDITDDINIHEWILLNDMPYIDMARTHRMRRDYIWLIPKDTVLCEFCQYSDDDNWGNKICKFDNHPVTGNNSCGRGVLK